MKYNSYSKLFVMLVFFDYLISLVSSIAFFTTRSSILNIVSGAIYVFLFIIFSSIVFYKFYNSIFEKKLLFAISGIITMLIGVLAMYLKRYISSPLLQQAVFLFFFLSLVVLYSVILIPIIRNKSVNNFYRGMYIFLFLILVSPLVNAILKSVITNYFIVYIENYISKLSSFSFLIFIFYYFFIVKDNIIKNPKINKRNVFFIMCVLLTLFSFILYFKSEDMHTVIISIYTTLSIRLYLPFYFYVFTTALLIITFIIGLLYADKTIPFIPLTLIVVTGLNATDFYIRVVSIFALIDIDLFVSFMDNSIEKSKEYVNIADY